MVQSKVQSIVQSPGFVNTLYMQGIYKQWNGLLEWNTGLDYWTELFSFLDKFLFYLATVGDCSNESIVI